MINNSVEEMCVLHFVYLLYNIYLNNLILLLDQLIIKESNVFYTNTYFIIRDY